MEMNTLSTYESALLVRARRNEVLAGNIANADTPGYKARDLDFQAALSQAQGGSSLQLATTSEMHRQSWGQGAAWQADAMCRVPMQPTLDGKTVETDVEQAQFAENAVQYQASLLFLSGKIRGLRDAIKGGA